MKCKPCHSATILHWTLSTVPFIPQRLLINFLARYPAIKFASREWNHAPLAEQNLLLIFSTSIFLFMFSHMVLANEIGRSLALVNKVGSLLRQYTQFLVYVLGVV
ncbi:hypothetical protein N7533_011426 [Penicillium manginii]|uniref:uncharacterized protein n=1 Tax=Penicillium manginii TaxID=203109 RepID=UPI00254682A1|nr:uncharacterized protein N7533_011426 [Penicillium manginii]KAJ5742017.1 hypothetical protein N7533_011426 [Penicillium manginii]